MQKMHICVRFFVCTNVFEAMRLQPFNVIRVSSCTLHITLAKTDVQKDPSPEIATGGDIYISIQSLNNHVFCIGIYIVYSSAQQQHAILLDSSSAAISIMSVCVCYVVGTRANKIFWMVSLMDPGFVAQMIRDI